MKTLSELIREYARCDTTDSYLERETPWDDIAFSHNDAKRQSLKQAILQINPSYEYF